jgi:hypothetical protein
MRCCNFYHDLEEKVTTAIHLVDILPILTSISVYRSCVVNMAELQTAVAICGVGSFSTCRDMTHQFVDILQ